MLYGDGYMSDKEWNAPMTFDTTLKKTASLDPKDKGCLWKKKKGWGGVDKKSEVAIPQLPIDQTTNQALAKALETELQSLGYQPKVLDFGSADSLSVNQVIAKAKSTGCDSVLVVQYRLAEKWRSDTYVKQGSQATTTKWFNFQGIRFEPRVSLWSADARQLWTAGNFGWYDMKKDRPRKVGKLETLKHEMSEMEAEGAKEASAKSPQQQAEDDYMEKLASQALLTAVAVNDGTYRRWVNPEIVEQEKRQQEQGKAQMEEMKAKMGSMYGGAGNPMGDMMGKMVDAQMGQLESLMDNIQKQREEDFPDRAKALERAAQKTAQEIFNPTAVSKASADKNKPFIWKK
ncbi:MAG: hypothetical protein HY747_11185 [Elusimicrobia bacterium]|nr:hypothetical protein [Elusimicrobiota bacterium]